MDANTRVGIKQDAKITARYLYPRWGQFFKPHDMLITETGTASQEFCSAGGELVEADHGALSRADIIVVGDKTFVLLSNELTEEG